MSPGSIITQFGPAGKSATLEREIVVDVAVIAAARVVDAVGALGEAGVPSKVTAVAPVKPVPVMVTVV